MGDNDLSFTTWDGNRRRLQGAVKEVGNKPAAIIEGQAEFLHNNEVSDLRLKRNITALHPLDALEALRSINPLLYRYKGLEIQHLHSRSTTTPDSKRQRYGVIAQDLQENLPELVDIIGASRFPHGSLRNHADDSHSHSTSSSTSLSPSFNSSMSTVYGVRYTSLIPVVIEALKSLVTRVENCTSIRHDLHLNITGSLDWMENEATTFKEVMLEMDKHHRNLIERTPNENNNST